MKTPNEIYQELARLMSILDDPKALSFFEIEELDAIEKMRENDHDKWVQFDAATIFAGYKDSKINDAEPLNPFLIASSVFARRKLGKITEQESVEILAVLSILHENELLSKL